MVSMIIIKRDGKPTTAMAQPQAESYLGNLVNANRTASLKQVMNDAFSGGGKPTGNYTFNTEPVLHASSGDGQQSVSIFFYRKGLFVNLFAMGEHIDLPKPKVRYKISDFGQAGTHFAEGSTVILK